MTPTKRIYLSPPHMGGRERQLVNEAFDSNWIAPVGPHVDSFEKEFAAKIGIEHSVALSSGTAALHLALRCINLNPGDEIFCSTLTFAGSANPIVYERATPVFIDSDTKSWNMDPHLLAEELKKSARQGKLPRAVIAVDLYGQCADLEAIRRQCEKYEVLLIEDAAEALGATYGNRHAGTFGWANIFSFNGNKIITTSGGGMLATHDHRLADRVRFLSQQARDPAPHYQHSEIGYNYRLSNVLAGIGRGQLELLESRVKTRRRTFELYSTLLAQAPGLTFMPEAVYGTHSRWLTCVLIDSNQFGATPEEVRLYLESQNIESRPIWKPMHLQPVFKDCRFVGGKVAERLFEEGLCLPSGSNLSEGDIRRVCKAVLSRSKIAARCVVR